MPSRTSPLPGLLLALSIAPACNQALGLDELRYDPPTPEQGSTDEATSAQQDEPASAEATLQDDSLDARGSSGTFPVRLGLARTIVSTPDRREDGLYVVYDRETGAVEAHRLDGEGGYVVTSSGSWKPRWSSVFLVPDSAADGQYWLGGYDEASELWENVAPFPSADWPEPQVSAGTLGWSHVAAVRSQDGWGLLTYDGKTGHYRLGPAALGVASPAPRAGEWAAGWSHLVDYPIGGAQLLKLSASTGDLATERLSLDPPMATRVHRGNLFEMQPESEEPAPLSPDSTVEALGADDDRLLVYEPEAGNVALVSIAVGESGELAAQIVGRALWREGLSSVTPLRLDGHPYAITYNSQTGVAELRDLDPLESNGVVIR